MTDLIFVGSTGGFDLCLLYDFPAAFRGTGAFGPNWQALNTSLIDAKRIIRVTTLNPRIENIHGVAKSES